MSRGQSRRSQRESQERIWDSFRRWGYLQANLDPLGDLKPVDMPDLDVTGPDADAARQILLRHDRRRVHAHPRSRAAPLDPGAHGIRATRRRIRSANSRAC